MKALVGCTGFVGSNLDAAAHFEGRYHSTNIQDAYGTNPDLLIYAGLPAAKYLANHEPEKDYAQIVGAEENIRRIAPKQLVLISTIDVLKNPEGVDETMPVETEGLAPYGLNRYRLEEWAREYYPDALIVRLPGLFGRNLKKNFIYDYIHRIPFMLNAQKYAELTQNDPVLRDYYDLQDNGFYQCRTLTAAEETELKGRFTQLGFTALNFTDSRSVYQFYPLSRLWQDIQTALDHHIKLLHLATEPVSAGEVYHYITGEEFKNYLQGKPAMYDYRTKYGKIFGSPEDYIMNKKEVLEKIEEFIYGCQH